VKVFGSTVPDAMRLSLLKFLGSNTSVSSTGFKSMLDYVGSIIKGEAAISRGAANLFSAGKAVIPASMVPTDKQLGALRKSVDHIAANSDSLLNVGGKTGHYLPEHQQAVAATSLQTANFLAANRPQDVKNSALASKPLPMSKADEAKYRRTATLAQQPLMLMEFTRNGTITTADVNVVKSLYPNVYASMVEKVNAQIVAAASKDQVIPYRLKNSISTLVGYPIDATQAPQAILAAQPVQGGASQGAQQGSPQTPPASSVAGLLKLPTTYQTEMQTRGGRSQRR